MCEDCFIYCVLPLKCEHNDQCFFWQFFVVVEFLLLCMSMCGLLHTLCITVEV